MTNGEAFIQVMNETFGMQVAPEFFQNRAYCNMFKCDLKCNTCKYDKFWLAEYRKPTQKDINRELIDNLVGDLDRILQREEEKKNSIDGISW